MNEAIRKATGADLDAVEKIYNELHDAEEYGDIWDVYPTRKTAEDSLKRGDLVLLEKRISL